MIRKQITFDSCNWPDYVFDKAIDWLKSLSNCFHIKRAKITSYRRKTDKHYCTRLEVAYE